jgi:hypothetical protein
MPSHPPVTYCRCWRNLSKRELRSSLLLSYATSDLSTRVTLDGRAEASSISSGAEDESNGPTA